MEKIELVLKIFFESTLPHEEEMQFFKDKLYGDLLKEVVCYLQPDCREKNLQKFFEELPQKERIRLLKTTFVYCNGRIKNVAKKLLISENKLFSEICFVCAEKVFEEEKLDLKLLATKNYLKAMDAEEQTILKKKFGVVFENLNLAIEQFLVDCANNQRIVDIAKKFTKRELAEIDRQCGRCGEHYFQDVDNPNLPSRDSPIDMSWTYEACRAYNEKDSFLRKIFEAEYFSRKW